MAAFKYRVMDRAHEPKLNIGSLNFVGGNELLFVENDRKTEIYRVEIGVLCLYRRLPGDENVPMRFAFPGDWVGLGFLGRHSLRARALVDTYVTSLPRGLVNVIVANDRRAKAQLDEANEREFEFVRNSIIRCGPPNPAQRVAAFLISLASINRNEGRDPSIIAESVKSGMMAECIGLNVASLRAVLVDFARRRLIETCPPGKLRLIDLAALEAIADDIPLDRSGVDGAARRSSFVVDYREIAEAV